MKNQPKNGIFEGKKICLKESVTQEPQESLMLNFNNPSCLKLVCLEQKFYLLSDKNFPAREVPEKAFSPLQPYFSWVWFSNYRSIPKPSDSTVHCPTVTCPLVPFHAQKSRINSYFLHFWGSTSTGALASPAKQSFNYQRCHKGSPCLMKIFSQFKFFSLHHI